MTRIVRTLAVLVGLLVTLSAYAPAFALTPLQLQQGRETAIRECGKFQGIELLEKKLPGVIRDQYFVVTDSWGGCREDFENMLPVFASTGLILKIDGPCPSWCPWLAATLPEDKVCVTKNPMAVLAFHKFVYFERRPDIGLVRKNSGDMNFKNEKIAAWVKLQGPLPEEGYKVMSNEEVRKIFRLCGSQNQESHSIKR